VELTLSVEGIREQFEGPSFRKTGVPHAETHGASMPPPPWDMRSGLCSAKRPVDVALGGDVPVALLLVQHADLGVGLRIRLTAADLARATAAPDLRLEEKGLADLAVLDARAGVAYEIVVFARGRAEGCIAGEAHL